MGRGSDFFISPLHLNTLLERRSYAYPLLHAPGLQVPAVTAQGLSADKASFLTSVSPVRDMALHRMRDFCWSELQSV